MPKSRLVLAFVLAATPVGFGALRLLRNARRVLAQRRIAEALNVAFSSNIVNGLP